MTGPWRVPDADTNTKKFTIQTPPAPISLPTTMEQAPFHFCRDCMTRKPINQFNLHQRNDKYGAKGEPTGRCTHCTVRNQQRHQDLKRKHGENPSGCLPEPSPALSTQQFMILLQEQALKGNLSYQTCVLTQGMTDEEGDIFDVIAACVWDATGFRFMFVWFLTEVQWLIFLNVQ